jgi:prolipoprotein diacylglyceryltransferase
MHEIIFQYGRLTIVTFNLLFAIALFVASIVIIRYAQLKKMNLVFILNHFPTALLIALITSRIFYVGEHWRAFLQNPLGSLFFWDMGFSAFGFLYGGLVILLYFARKDRESFWAWLDGFTIAGLAALCFVHIGHFFNGTMYGKPTDLPWGMVFDTQNIPYFRSIHPVQLYSAITSFVICFSAIKFSKRTHHVGVVGTLAILLYSLSAFGFDFLRGSQSNYLKVNYILIASLALIGYIESSHSRIMHAQRK